MITDERRMELRAQRPARKAAKSAAKAEATRVARARGARKHGSHHRNTPKPGFGNEGRAHVARGRWVDPPEWEVDVCTHEVKTGESYMCTIVVDPDNGTYAPAARHGEPEPGYRGTGEVLSWGDKAQHMGYTPR